MKAGEIEVRVIVNDSGRDVCQWVMPAAPRVGDRMDIDWIRWEVVAVVWAKTTRGRVYAMAMVR